MVAITIALLSPVALMTAEEEAVSGLEAEATEPSVASFHCVVPETPLAEAVGTTATSLPEATTSMFRLMPASLKMPPTWLRAVLTAVRTSASVLAPFRAFLAWVRALGLVQAVDNTVHAVNTGAGQIAVHFGAGSTQVLYVIGSEHTGSKDASHDNADQHRNELLELVHDFCPPFFKGASLRRQLCAYKAQLKNSPL